MFDEVTDQVRFSMREDRAALGCLEFSLPPLIPMCGCTQGGEIIHVVYGDFAEPLREVLGYLQKALPYADNEIQKVKLET